MRNQSIVFSILSLAIIAAIAFFYRYVEKNSFSTGKNTPQTKPHNTEFASANSFA